MDLEDVVMGSDFDVVGALLARGKGAQFQSVSRHEAAEPVGPSTAARRWMKTATAQGVSLPQEEMDYLPTVADTLTSLKLSGAAVAFPQRPFRGERLLCSALFIPAVGAVADVSNAVFLSPAVYAGAVQIGASQGDTPFSVFANNAFGVRLSFPTMGQGTRLYVPDFTSVVLGVGDKIVIGVTIIGRAVR
jgi:hypothetical protein